MKSDESVFPAPSGNQMLGYGLTKRELFAALIMQGFAASDPNSGRMLCDREDVAKMAVNRADDLIEALQSTEKGS